ncbi:MAG: glycosyltransferase, partial [Promethearchaeota archaeon]
MSGYVLATKFFNERVQLPSLIANIAEQTLEPTVIVFIDDGSTDGSVEVARSEAAKFDLSFKVVSMPMKAEGNLDTLGRAWNKAQPLLEDLLSDIPYFATVDVDTRFPSNYFEYMVNYLDSHPSIGVVAGQVAGDARRTFPMFTGKVVRSNVVRYIDKYWDISIDSFLNIKALKLGYELSILDDVEVHAPRSHLQSKKGRFRAGRLAYYGGTGPLYAISKALAKIDSEFLRGYWFEFFKGTWRCDDKDILKYYRSEFTRKSIQKLKRLTHL